ncbi:MAG: type II toxin-antitoxin system Phd/YefM family antitoxin [Trueperaceae bacterium]
MAGRSVSIAEARARLPGLVKEAEAGEPIHITRWGEPVAVLVSSTRYQQLVHGRPSFGAALDRHFGGVEMTEVGLDRDEPEDLRDRGAGRVAPW